MSSFSEVREIVKVFDYFEEGGSACIVLEYVQGVSLRSILEKREEPMSFEEGWEFLQPVRKALCKIHQKGIIHRDISPDNLLVRKDGSIKLIDFGSARVYRENEKTMTSYIKTGYAPPEQYERKGKQGPWTDVYSFCAVLYEMITGVILPSSVERQQKDSLYLPSSYGTQITPQQEMALMQGLAPDYRKRFAGFPEMEKALLPEEKNKKNKKKGDTYDCSSGSVYPGYRRSRRRPELLSTGEKPEGCTGKIYSGPGRKRLPGTYRIS